MKTTTLLFILTLLLSVNTFGQRTQQFGRFTDATGKNIAGTSMEKGYERQIIIDDLQINTTDVIRIQITIPNSDAVNSFQSAATSKSPLQSGEISVIKSEADRKVLHQKILMNSIRVVSVYVRDESATIDLETGSFNQTFYTVDRNGKVIPIKK